MEVVVIIGPANGKSELKNDLPAWLNEQFPNLWDDYSVIWALQLKLSLLNITDRYWIVEMSLLKQLLYALHSEDQYARLVRPPNAPLTFHFMHKSQGNTHFLSSCVSFTGDGDITVMVCLAFPLLLISEGLRTSRSPLLVESTADVEMP